MIGPHILRDYVRAEPFRPFRIDMAGGKTYEIRHPEKIRVMKNTVLVFGGGDEEFPDRFETVSLMLTESVSPIEASNRQP